MYDGTADHLSVAFPATEQFLRLGRVTVSGLALRLGVELAIVENLRAAIDLALSHLAGVGTINLQASWEPGHLAIDLENTEQTIDEPTAARLQDELRVLVVDAQVNTSHIVIAIEDEVEATPRS
ncbi:MAG: hypothetical protein R2706_15805 [Acidimicrobiales bacterium]